MSQNKGRRDAMNFSNTENSSMNILKDAGWEIIPSYVYTVSVIPPSAYFYSASQKLTIDENLHENLLNESLTIYDDIWHTLAQM